MKKVIILITVLVLSSCIIKPAIKSLTEYDLNKYEDTLSRGWDVVNISEILIPDELDGRIRIYYETSFGIKSYKLKTNQKNIRGELRGLTGNSIQSGELNNKISYFRYILQGNKQGYLFDDITINSAMLSSISSSANTESIKNNQYINCFVGTNQQSYENELDAVFNSLRFNPNKNKDDIDPNIYYFISWIEIEEI